MHILRYPPNVQWEVTTECNHNCIHCYNYWRKDSEKIAEISKVKTEKQYLELAKKILAQKPVSVVVTGGEPLMVFSKIRTSMDLLLNNGIFVSINTNAALLNENIIEYLKERKIGLFVSFPCSNENVCNTIINAKSFKTVVEKLDMAYENRVHFSINIVVSKLNINYVEETVEFLKDRYNISKVSITRVGKPINSSEKFNEVLLNKEDIKRLQEISVKVHKKYDVKVETSCPYTACSLYSQEAYDLFGNTKICTAGKTSYAVDTDGNVKACPRDSELYGNILNEDFEDIWSKLHCWRDNTYLPDECKKCTSLPMCMGGCRVDSLPFTGRLDKLDRISDVNNLPIKFTKTKSVESTKRFCKDDEFCVSYKANYITDGMSIRISVGRMYMFITKELYKFLKDNKFFRLEDLERNFNVDVNVANSVVKTLMSNNIIYKT